jgi:hypothetical protein
VLASYITATGCFEWEERDGLTVRAGLKHCLSFGESVPKHAGQILSRLRAMGMPRIVVVLLIF